MASFLKDITHKVKSAMAKTSYLQPLGRMSDDGDEFLNRVQYSFLEAVTT